MIYGGLRHALNVSVFPVWPYCHSALSGPALLNAQVFPVIVLKMKKFRI